MRKKISLHELLQEPSSQPIIIKNSKTELGQILEATVIQTLDEGDCLLEALVTSLSQEKIKTLVELAPEKKNLENDDEFTLSDLINNHIRALGDEEKRLFLKLEDLENIDDQGVAFKVMTAFADHVKNKHVATFARALIGSVLVKLVKENPNTHNKLLDEFTEFVTDDSKVHPVPEKEKRIKEAREAFRTELSSFASKNSDSYVDQLALKAWLEKPANSKITSKALIHYFTNQALTEDKLFFSISTISLLAEILDVNFVVLSTPGKTNAFQLDEYCYLSKTNKNDWVYLWFQKNSLTNHGEAIINPKFTQGTFDKMVYAIGNRNQAIPFQDENLWTKPKANKYSSGESSSSESDNDSIDGDVNRVVLIPDQGAPNNNSTLNILPVQPLPLFLNKARDRLSDKVNPDEKNIAKLFEEIHNYSKTTWTISEINLALVNASNFSLTPESAEPRNISKLGLKDLGLTSNGNPITVASVAHLRAQFIDLVRDIGNAYKFQNSGQNSPSFGEVLDATLSDGKPYLPLEHVKSLLKAIHGVEPTFVRGSEKDFFERFKKELLETDNEVIVEFLAPPRTLYGICYAMTGKDDIPQDMLQELGNELTTQDDVFAQVKKIKMIFAKYVEKTKDSSLKLKLLQKYVVFLQKVISYVPANKIPPDLFADDFFEVASGLLNIKTNRELLKCFGLTSMEADFKEILDVEIVRFLPTNYASLTASILNAAGFSDLQLKRVAAEQSQSSEKRQASPALALNKSGPNPQLKLPDDQTPVVSNIPNNNADPESPIPPDVKSATDLPVDGSLGEPEEGEAAAKVASSSLESTVEAEPKLVKELQPLDEQKSQGAIDLNLKSTGMEINGNPTINHIDSIDEALNGLLGELNNVQLPSVMEKSLELAALNVEGDSTKPLGTSIADQILKARDFGAVTPEASKDELDKSQVPENPQPPNETHPSVSSPSIN